MATGTISTVVQAVFAPKRSIGPMTAMVTIAEAHHDEMMVTDHPVELGARISDHAIALPSELHIIAGWSKSPNFSRAGFGALLAIGDNLVSSVLGQGAALDYLQQVYSNLRKLMLDRIPMDIWTGKRIYTDMLITALTTETRAETENSMIIEIDCRQVIIVGQATKKIPKDQQKTPEKTNNVQDFGVITPIPVK